MTLPSRDARLTRRVALGLLGAAAMLAPGAVAWAVPPTAADFQIRYYTTDENGERGRVMTLQDLQQFVGQARCECNQLIEAVITLTSTSGQAFDQQQIRTFAGSNCAAGQLGNTSQNNPCVQLDSQLPNFYTKAPSFKFPAIWLSSGVSGSTQSIGDAVPERSCNSGAGEGGIWICVENQMQTDCQPEEFIIQGTQNINVPQTMTGMMASGAMAYDYDAPLTVPTNFQVSEGDGAIRVSWDQQTTSDINGYRILCADADDNPVDGKGIDTPSVTAENQGTVYFTPENLCPGGPFDDTPEGEIDGPMGPSDGGTDGGTDGGDFGSDGGDFGSGGGTFGTFGAYDGDGDWVWSGDPLHGGGV
ncbi:MAG: hypothetical protein AAF721_22235, partial [Myxococcota bacterium]